MSDGNTRLGSNPVDKVDVGVVVDERVLGRFGRRLVAGTSLAEVSEPIPASTPERKKIET